MRRQISNSPTRTERGEREVALLWELLMSPTGRLRGAQWALRSSWRRIIEGRENPDQGGREKGSTESDACMCVCVCMRARACAQVGVCMGCSVCQGRCPCPCQCQCQCRSRGQWQCQGQCQCQCQCKCQCQCQWQGKRKSVFTAAREPPGDDASTAGRLGDGKRQAHALSSGNIGREDLCEEASAKSTISHRKGSGKGGE